MVRLSLLLSFLFISFIGISQAKKAPQKKASATKSSSVKTQPQQSASSGKPNRAPGTEGKDPHPEATYNSLLPQFEFVTSQKTMLNNKNLPANKSTIFALFSPSCDHCEKAFSVIRNNIEAYKDFNIVFVTFAEYFHEIDSFIKVKNVVNLPNVYLCGARSQFIINYFMPNIVLPQVMVFDKQRRLKRIFYETVNNDSLLYYLNK